MNADNTYAKGTWIIWREGTTKRGTVEYPLTRFARLLGITGDGDFVAAEPYSGRVFVMEFRAEVYAVLDRDFYEVRAMVADQHENDLADAKREKARKARVAKKAATA